MFSTEEWLEVGKIVSAQGLKGELRVQPASDFSERFTKPGKRWLQKSNENPKEINLLSGRQIPGKSLFVISISGINDRTKADSLIGDKFLVLASDIPKLNTNEYHFLDLVNLEVKLSKESQPIGKITNLINAGNDLLEIESNEGKKILIPFVKTIVPTIDLKNRWIIVNPPNGLLDLENLD